MNRYFMLLLCLSLLYASVFGVAVSADDSITVRVGTYENHPKIFTDDKGNVSGFWPDIIEHIASEEGWEIDYIHGTWGQCLTKLEKNEIDMMPDVAYTEERSRRYDFSNETVYVSWSGVYAREGADIQSILDLGGKNIAVLEGSVNVEGPEGIKELVRAFDINCNFTEVDSYTRVFELVESGEADAGVTNRDFAYQHLADFKIVKTAIIFQPASLYFAFPKESNLKTYLTERIDYPMKELKEDEDSVYYQSLEKWLGVKPLEKAVVPGWIKWALICIGGLALLLAGGSFILRSQVRARTKELTAEIIERKQAEAALRESEEKFRAIFDESRDGIVLIDSETGYIIDCNPEYERQTGRKLEQLKKMKIWELRPLEKIEAAKEIFFKIRDKGVGGSADLAFQKPNGEIVPIDFLTRVVTLGGKKYMQSMTRDITERKQAEEALKESEERFRAIFDNATDGILLAEIEAKKFYTGNNMICQMLGYSLEEIKNLGVMDIHPEDDLPYVIEQFEKQAKGEFPLAKDIPVKRKDGSVFYAEINSSQMTLAGKTYLVGIFRDITERRKMQEQLIVTDRLASVGELAAGIAHEINNPLTSVIGFSDLLLQKDLPGDVREDLQVVNREARRTADIIRNLLTFARKHEAEKAPTDINKVIENVLALRAYEQKVHNIEVKADLAPDLPEITADGFKLQQVFLNIVINAEHFMTKAHGKGTLTINTKRIGDTVQASFADDGPGIPEEDLSHLFDPFFTTKEVGVGTGLGLSICHGIIAEHGGRIYAEGEVGEGATFIMELPITQ